MKLKLLSEKDCADATSYMLELEKEGALKYERDHEFGPRNKETLRSYMDPYFCALALQVQPQLEAAWGTQLYPTYTYTRLYKEGFILRPHTDRPACELSSSITIGYGGRDTPWELYIENDDKEEVEYILEPGEGLLYEGRKYTHWRYPLDEGWQIQTFVHYIQIGGEVYQQVRYKQPDFDFSIPFQDFDYTSAKGSKMFINKLPNF